MFNKLFLLILILMLMACESSDVTESHRSQSLIDGQLAFNFNKTEAKSGHCIPRFKAKEVNTGFIDSIQGEVEFYRGLNEKFHELKFNVTIGQPLETVLAYSQSITCDELSLKIKIDQCYSRSEPRQTIACPAVSIIQADLLGDIVVSQ